MYKKKATNIIKILVFAVVAPKMSSSLNKMKKSISFTPVLKALLQPYFVQTNQNRSPKNLE